ncbi:phage tail assembly protein [Breoghania sp.]|uniref:phage tail assembly protein n=1 Tax=Breoghania sp. TaxID=2065378 RepID=UPI0029CA6678|nr:phage tail assembly protein [Breoghania sp.]
MSTNPADVDVREIALPPEELTEDLDNSAENSAPSPAPREVASLEFLSDPATRETTVDLDHPFRYEGREVRKIRIRKLTVAEVGRAADRNTGDGFDLYEVYAAMTGFPASVLRGLMDDDGDAVVERAYGFLPRAFRAGGD